MSTSKQSYHTKSLMDGKMPNLYNVHVGPALMHNYHQCLVSLGFVTCNMHATVRKDMFARIECVQKGNEMSACMTRKFSVQLSTCTYDFCDELQNARVSCNKIYACSAHV